MLESYVSLDLSVSYSKVIYLNTQVGLISLAFLI